MKQPVFAEMSCEQSFSETNIQLFKYSTQKFLICDETTGVKGFVFYKSSVGGEGGWIWINTAYMSTPPLRTQLEINYE